MGVVQWWLRDVWLQTLDIGSKPDALAPEPSGQLLNFPALAGTRKIAQRVSPQEAMDNLRILEQLQRWLSTNVQEALALEVGLLKLHL